MASTAYRYPFEIRENYPLPFLIPSQILSALNRAEGGQKVGTRAIHKLSARRVATARDGMHGDGGGLFLKVSGNARSWVWRYTRDGRKREMGLGSASLVSLAVARERAAQGRELVAAGRDPIADKTRPEAPVRALGRATTFGQAADAFLDQHLDQWSNPKHRQQWRNTLNNHAQRLAHLPVAEIDVAAVASVLQPIWTSKPETASRLRGRIERVLARSIALGQRDGPNPAAWKGNLEYILPRQTQRVKHHRAIPVADAPAAFQTLWDRRDNGQSYRALIAAVLLAMRSGEARGMTWGELDSDMLTIGPDRMKAKRGHRIPLVPEVATWLDSLPRMAGTDLVFPSARNTPLSENALGVAMKDSALDATVHGWRSTFSDWANAAGWDRHLIEDALAHQVGTAVERAYRRGDFAEQRRPLMAAWHGFLAGAV